MRWNKERYNTDLEYRDKCRIIFRKRHKRSKERHYFKYAARSLRYKFRIQIVSFDLWKIAKRQRLTCPITGRHLTRTNISVDHIIPLSKGGTNDFSNLRFIDHHANLAKASFSESELLALAKDIIKTLK